jgi:hypothetical protein
MPKGFLNVLKLGDLDGEPGGDSWFSTRDFDEIVRLIRALDTAACIDETSRKSLDTNFWPSGAKARISGGHWRHD